MKVLTVCAGGQIRSVCMANHLIEVYGLNAVPQGVLNPFPDNFNWYTIWADKIIVMQPEFEQKVPVEQRGKILICDVGPDVFGNPNNPDLLEKVKTWCEQNSEVLKS